MIFKYKHSMFTGKIGRDFILNALVKETLLAEHLPLYMQRLRMISGYAAK